jgi:LCP family protein required for cell wall assembly
MPDERHRRTPVDDPPYRVYRSGGRAGADAAPKRGGGIGGEAPPRSGGRGSADARGSARRFDDRARDQRSGLRGSARTPYRRYRARPRFLQALLGHNDELALQREEHQRRRAGLRRGPGARTRKRLTVGRVIKYLALAVVFWLGLSLVLFMISAGTQQVPLPASASSALTPGGNMLTSADTILILGTDQRPRTGPGSKEPGANYNVAGSNSDTIMLWRVGGGVSRRLSIPRDTVAAIPGHGLAKINAGFAIGGPALAIKTVEQFTGIKINHVIVVNLARFPPFINAIGGISVRTEHVCANISGGPKDGGFALDLKPGVHHLNGLQALLYARVRENPCNPADSDLTRVQHQQEILNAIKSQLLSVGTFFRLPWASWDAPQVLESDMGGPTLLTLFAASEIGGSAPVNVLKPTGAEYLPGYGDALTVTPQAVHSAVHQLMDG